MVRIIGRDLIQKYAETNYETCELYDRHYITTQDMIREFVAWRQVGIDDIENGTNTQNVLIPKLSGPRHYSNLGLYMEM